MKAETAKRLFRLVASEKSEDLRVLCLKIVEEEFNKGHKSLAKELALILEKSATVETPPRTTINNVGVKHIRSLNEYALNSTSLPKSRRFNDPLVQLIPFEQLRHHLVLPEAVLKRYERIIKEYAARDRLAKHGLTYKRKVLIYGPPGCGKTLSAEYLAWRTGLPLVKVRLDALISSYFGESAANLRSVFESTSHTQCVLFLDECDFIAKSRTTGNDVGEVSRLVNTLLTLLEEYKAPGLLIAATNLTSTLDKAIFRRFDEVFQVPRPTKHEVERLLRATLASFIQPRSKLIESIVPLLDGNSASTIVNIANDSAAAVVLEGREYVQADDLKNAIERHSAENH